MLNFTYYNPTRIVFGKGTIAELEKLVPRDAKVLLLYGGGSIQRNGVYDQVRRALARHSLVEHRGIEANPHYETCLQAVATVRAEKVAFLLAVGGGSVIDAAKFIAAAAVYPGAEPWDLIRDWSLVRGAVPLGAVLTLPGTGSEMNGGAVISRQTTREKLYFVSEHTFPRFSILDPETTYSLPPRQFANGAIDAFVQVLEQYLTYDVDAPLQDRFAEGILLTILQEAPKVQADPRNYAARANLMWCATNGLNGAIGCGVPQDWTSHAIGHELTALYGVDHGQSLALVMPLVMRHQRTRKRAKLLQYAQRVWGLTEGDGDEAARIEGAVAKTEAFFRSLGASTRLADCGVPPAAAAAVAARLARRNLRFGEHQDIGSKEVEEIMEIGIGD
jgi:NADP-dependent alcohol dehydrogenase